MNLEKNKEQWSTWYHCFTLAANKHPLKAFESGRNSQDSDGGRRSASWRKPEDTIGSVESLSLSLSLCRPINRPSNLPLREKTGKRTLTLRGRMARPDAPRNERKLRLDSMLGNTIYGKGAGLRGTDSAARRSGICRYSSRSEIERLLVARRPWWKRRVSRKIELSFIHSRAVISAEVVSRDDGGLGTSEIMSTSSWLKIWSRSVTWK